MRTRHPARLQPRIACARAPISSTRTAAATAAVCTTTRPERAKIKQENDFKVRRGNEKYKILPFWKRRIESKGLSGNLRCVCV